MAVTLWIRFLAVPAVAALCACSTLPIVGSADVRAVQVDGEKVWVAPMRDPGAWGATRFAAMPFPVPNPAMEKALLSRAVQMATGCSVSHTHYDMNSANLYATVECKAAH